LSLDETNVMVASLSLPSGNSQRLASMIRDLTGGQPAATHLLLDVIADRHSGLVELDELLRSRRGAMTVDDALHARLLAGIPHDAIDDLTTCAAARDRASGRLIAQSGLVSNRSVFDAAALAAGLWSADDNDEPTLIRRLLLRRLARRPEDHPASWINVHQWLYSDALERAESPRTDRYYAVALDRWDVAAEVLTARLGTDSLSSWLATLHAVSWAPRQPTLDGGDDAPAVVAARYAAPYAGREPIFTTVINLLTSLSVAHDPLCGSMRGGLYWQIAARYAEISHHTGSGCDELASLVHQYQAKARQWQQQPAPAQPTGGHRVVGQSTGNAR
jgi:hypothetical protein